MKIENKIFHIISYFTILSANLFLLIIFFWLIYPYKTVEYNDKIFKVLTPKIKAGGILVYEVNACKYSEKKPIISVLFVNDVQYLSTDNFAAIGIGCRKTLVERKVPETLPAGRYNLEIIVTYEVNPIRNIVFKNFTDKFEIIK